MPAPVMLLAAASGFACLSPTHHDGDNVRCANIEESIRLQGIDAPEMPGSCRPGRQCTPGDPYAARDHLRGLTQGRTLDCSAEGQDRYGRVIARCAVAGLDLSCAMIASGHAVPRYAALDCGPAAAPPVAEPVPPPEAPPVAAEPVGPVIGRDQAALDPPPARNGPSSWLLAVGWLVLINLITYAAFAIDKARAERQRRRFHPERRIPETTLFGLAALGGSAAAWLAIFRLRHKSAKARFQQTLLLISGVQIGAMMGGIWWVLGG